MLSSSNRVGSPWNALQSRVDMTLAARERGPGVWEFKGGRQAREPESQCATRARTVCKGSEQRQALRVDMAQLPTALGQLMGPRAVALERGGVGKSDRRAREERDGSREGAMQEGRRGAGVEGTRLRRGCRAIWLQRASRTIHQRRVAATATPAPSEPAIIFKCCDSCSNPSSSLSLLLLRRSTLSRFVLRLCRRPSTLSLVSCTACSPNNLLSRLPNHNWPVS
jgi:hypothetical protein